MKQLFPCSAKRALSFVLALVLFVSLVPMNVWADEVIGNWTYKDSYSWISGSFETSDADQVYQDSQAYDWSVIVVPTKSPPASAQVVASITDASGKTISSYNGTVSGMAQRVESTLCSYENFPELTTSLFGSFVLTVELKLSGSTYAKLVQPFKRVSSNLFTSTVTSRSNPDNVFTFADPIDLVLNIKRNDGVAAACNAAVTVTNKNGTQLLAARGVSLPASTNITLSVKDLVDLPTILTSGTYNVNLTLTNSQGAIQHEAFYPFAVVALEDSLTATVTSATSPSFAFNNVDPDLVLNLQKNDGVAETLNTAITVTDSTGKVVLSETFETTTATATITPDLSGLAATGNFKLSATITDDAGNLRGSASANFARTNNVPMTATLTNFNTDNKGDIYYSGDDFNVSLKITHKPSAKQSVTVKATGILNGKAFEKTRKVTLSSTGVATTKIDGAFLASYGIFQDLALEVYDAAGTKMWESTTTYNFSRVLDTSTPGDLSLMNLNVHYTNMGTEPMLAQVNFAATAGASMWRSSITWDAVEKTKGVYKMPSQLTEVMNQTRTTGMQALIILAYNNNNTDANGNLFYGEVDPDNTTWVNAYAEYCYQVALYMAKNYPDQVVGFEIWNEWNHATMSKVPDKNDRTGAKYAKVVIAASKRIREVNKAYGTNFKVIAGAAAGDGYIQTTNSYKFITSLLSTTGIMDAIDGYSFHTYPKPEKGTNSSSNPRLFEFVSPEEFDYVNRIKFVQDLMKKYGADDTKEIWLTETGWSTAAREIEVDPDDGTTHITTGATELEAAAYMVQLYAWALVDGKVDRIFWYDLMNDQKKYDGVLDWNPDKGECNWGLIHSFGNTADEGEPLAYSAKPGYAALCALSSKLSGATNGKFINLGSGIYAYQFEKGSNYVMVAWTNGTPTTLNATLTGNMVITDMYGNAVTYSNSAKLELSETPIYIEYAKSSHPSIG